MGATGFLVHVMGVDDFIFLSFFPPHKSLFLVSALSFEQVLNNKLLVLVPSHFQWFLIGIDEIIDLFVVYLEE